MTNVTQPDNNWFSTALLGCIDGFFDWNPVSGNITLSSSFKAILGYSRQDFMGDNKDFFLKNLHADDQETVMKEFASFFASNRMEFHGEVRLKIRNGEFRWFRIQGKGFRDSIGKCLRFAGIVLNIHEYKNNLSESVENSNSKSKFIAMLNHELRSPLASIISTAKLLPEEPLTEQQLRYTENIIQSADLLLMLVNDILDVSKIAAGKLEIENKPFDFAEVINQTVEMCKPNIHPKGLEIHVQLDQSIPKALIGDSMRIQQIILNLLTNAVKFTDKGSLHINTKFTQTTDARGKLYVEVVDTGIGIPEDRLGCLFQDFVQADISTSRKYGGTGLGLSICKKIIDLMGGEINVRSKENIGSTFFFELPVGIVGGEKPYANGVSGGAENSVKEQRAVWQAGGSQDGNATIEASASSQASVKTPQLRVLVAEDNRVNQEVMKGLLGALKHDIVIAQNGQEAFELCSKENFDVILMDINMPIMDGVQATMAIREKNKDIPIIAVTANSLDSERTRCLESGMNDFITKPVDKQKLAKILEPYINKGDRSALRDEKVSEAPSKDMIYIEESALRQLMADLGETKIKQFIDMYKKDAVGLIENLKKNVEMEHAAHTLAGMSENLNFTAMGKRSREILHAVKEDGDGDRVNGLVHDLPTLYAETLRCAEGLLA